MRLRYFVLRKGQSGQPASLECYDNEKAFSDGQYYKK